MTQLSSVRCSPATPIAGRRWFSTLGLFAGMAIAALAATGAAEPGPALKDAYKPHFPIGTAINRAVATGQGWRRSEEEVRADVALVLAQFDHVVAENEMKWASLHPRPGADGYDWAAADAFVEFGQKHGMELVGHTLVWHSQTPHWVFEPGRRASSDPAPADPPNAASAAPSPNPSGPPPGGPGGPGARGRRPGFEPFDLNGPRATREELLERMREHIHTVMGRYKGKIKVWDVVNEAISDHGPDILRVSPWSVIIGPDFIDKAFQFAHEADPEAVLRYNDYGLENPEKRRKCLALIKQLKDRGVPVMALGSQAHLNVAITFETMDQCLAELKSAGLPVHITELDINGAQGGQRSTGADVAGNSAATQGDLVADADRRLTDAYTAVFRAFLKHREAVRKVTFWGPNDANSWRRRGQPLLFDADARPKPAFHAVIALAGSPEHPPATDGTAKPAAENAAPAEGAAAELSGPEAAFAAMLKNATLRGSWAPIDKRLLGEEQEDGYRIVRAEKVNGSRWSLVSRFRFQGQEIDVPFPVTVHFAGDAAVLALDQIPLGDGTLWSARILFHDDVYAGSWWGADKAVKSGVVSGTITREP